MPLNPAGVFRAWEHTYPNVVSTILCVCLTPIDPSSTNQSNADYKTNVNPQTLTTNTTSTFTFTVPDSWGKIDELTGSTYRSQAWKSGYSDGFFGYDLEGHHTKDFFYGYENGSQNFQVDRGYADGLSGKPLHPPHWSGILARAG